MWHRRRQTTRRTLAHGVLGHEGPLRPQPPVNDHTCRGMDTQSDCTAACCAIGLGTTWSFCTRFPAKKHAIGGQQLAAQDSELAQQIAKDPYNFEFLGLSGEVADRDLEQALLDRIVDTLRELGPGFTFVGRQVHFDVGGDDFFLDLILFHVEQLRYIVIELKTGKFQPEHAGQLNFYVAFVDDRLRREAHADTVGILICGDKNDHTARYSLGRSVSPLAVASYTYDSLPATERAGLPDAEKLTAALVWPSEETSPSAPEK